MVIALIITIGIFAVVVFYASCVVAAEADRQAEEEHYKYCDDDCIYCNISRQCVRSAMRRQEEKK